MRATLFWAIIACAGATGLVAATKPTDSEGKQAVSKAVKGSEIWTSSALYPALSLAGAKMPGTADTDFSVFTVDNVDITQWGGYNEANGYWPVEACLSVSARQERRGGVRSGGAWGVFPPGAAIRFNVRMRFRVKRDDFGAWAATEIQPAGNELSVLKT